jgi:hypothetical protein
MDKESMDSLDGKCIIPTRRVSAQEFQVVNVTGPGIIKPTLLEACLEAIEDQEEKLQVN